MIVITVARKPPIGTVPVNALRCGTGGLNIDRCRIATTPSDRESMLHMSAGFIGRKWGRPELVNYGYEGSMPTKTLSVPHDAGRWPANLILLHRTDCVPPGEHHRNGNKRCFTERDKPALPDISYAGQGGKETVTTWACVAGCPVPALDEQSGFLHPAYRDPVKAVAQLAKRKPSIPRGVTGFDDRKPCTIIHMDGGSASRFFKQVGGQRK